MAELKLTAENAGQERILKYLEENASDVLAEKINGGNKTMAGCWTYIVSRAGALQRTTAHVSRTPRSTDGPFTTSRKTTSAKRSRHRPRRPKKWILGFTKDT